MSDGRILYINLGNFGSTGTIMKMVGEYARNNGFCSFYAFPETGSNTPREKNDIIICSGFRRKIAEKISFYSGFRGVWLHPEAKRLLKKFDEIMPEIIHLNNLHDTYINLPELFHYIKVHKLMLCGHFMIAGHLLVSVPILLWLNATNGKRGATIVPPTVNILQVAWIGRKPCGG